MCALSDGDLVVLEWVRGVTAALGSLTWPILLKLLTLQQLAELARANARAEGIQKKAAEWPLLRSGIGQGHNAFGLRSAICSSGFMKSISPGRVDSCRVSVANGFRTARFGVRPKPRGYPA